VVLKLQSRSNLELSWINFKGHSSWEA